MLPYYVVREARAIADLSEDADVAKTWVIHRINVPVDYRGRGFGADLLRQILADADKEKITLWLLPMSSGGLTDAQLIAWYTRYGFKWEKKPGESRMIREPKES